MELTAVEPSPLFGLVFIGLGAGIIFFLIVATISMGVYKMAAREFAERSVQLIALLVIGASIPVGSYLVYKQQDVRIGATEPISITNFRLTPQSNTAVKIEFSTSQETQPSLIYHDAVSSDERTYLPDDIHSKVSHSFVITNIAQNGGTITAKINGKEYYFNGEPYSINPSLWNR